MSDDEDNGPKPTYDPRTGGKIALYVILAALALVGLMIWVAG